jgi:hypothetical protein
MYPSFDTRRVLCKQHRPYCVKPLRARLKPSNALSADAALSELRKPTDKRLAARNAKGFCKTDTRMRRIIAAKNNQTPSSANTVLPHSIQKHDLINTAQNNANGSNASQAH